MDFLSKIIKRPLSINNSFTTTDAATTSADGSSTTSTTSTSTRNAALIPIAMNRPNLSNLLDSAAQDLAHLEEQHTDLITADPIPMPATNQNREGIQQLLDAINVNLNQVSAHEMEHLQAMSAELSPLAVKPSTKPTMAAAMRPNDPLKLDETTPMGGVTFGGLPEFDESQIPELASLNADMTAQLKAEAAVASLSLTQDYHSDSDIYAECLSLNSDEKYTADHSELEAYTSALNEVLEHDKTLGESGNHNTSCEPMDVDDINETMEILKDVMAAEDHQLLQQQLLVTSQEKQLQAEQEEYQKIELTKLEQTVMVDDAQQLNLEKQQTLEDLNQTHKDKLQLLEDKQQLQKDRQQFEEQELAHKEKLQLLEQKQQDQNARLQLAEQEQAQKEELQLHLQEERQRLHEEKQTLYEENQTLQDERLLLQEEKKNLREEIKAFQEEVQHLQENQISVKQAEQQLQEDVQQLAQKESRFEGANEQLEQKAQAPSSPPIATLQLQITNLPVSPPIPTHRTKTAEQMEAQFKENEQHLDETTAASSLPLSHLPVSSPIPTNQIKAIKEIEPQDEVQVLQNRPKAPSSPPLPTLLQASQVDLPKSPPIPTLQNQGAQKVEQHLPKEVEESVEEPNRATSPPIPTLQAVKVDRSFSPPIPTHRPKKFEELLSLQDLPDLPDDEDEPAQPTAIMAIKPTQLRRPTTPLSLDMISSTVSSSHSSACTSPSFPVKEPAAAPAHFPRSPNAAPEQEGMPYLEQGVIEPSIERKVSMCNEGGVIAKSPLSIQVTHPTPEKREVLNETVCMGENSPLTMNGTFDGEKRSEISPISAAAATTLEAVSDSQRRTFSVGDSTEQLKEDIKPTRSLDEQNLEKCRRTFNLEEQQLEKHRRTFNLEQQQQEKHRRTFNLEEQQLEKHRRTFNLEVQQQQHTLPAEEVAEDLEPMDVDVSLCVTEVPPRSFSPPIPTHQHKLPKPMAPSSPSLPAQLQQQPQFARPPIHAHNRNATIFLEEETLSAKEQATLSASDEKDDVFVEHFGAISPVSDDIFKTPQYTSSNFNNLAKNKLNGAAGPTRSSNRIEIAPEQEQFFDAEFQSSGSNNHLIFNSSDFDYLYTKGSNNAPIDRSSLLLKFDPLLGTPVPVNHPQQQEQAIQRALSPTLEEHETSGASSQSSFVVEASDKSQRKPPVDRTKKNAKMSVDVIGNDSNKTFDQTNLNSEDKVHYHNMDEMEKKIKNEVTRSEDIEKKLKDAEQREEALIKRITEKDKTNLKLNDVIQAYEKAIAELIHEKEQLVQNYERQLQEVQTDRDSNYHHLTSLETTFSDLHVKYEKSKYMTSQLKNNEESLQAEKKQLTENLRLQEQRYEKMKSHAMQQLEIANKKLDTNTKEHADEIKKLKALLKKEEVSRVSTAEQLQQKSRENADLLKICEELIYGKGQGGSS